MNGFDDDRAAARAVRKLSRQMGADRRTDREQGYEFPKALRIGAPWALIPLTFLAAAVLQLAFFAWQVEWLGGVLFGGSAVALSLLRWKLSHQRTWWRKVLEVADVAAPLTLIMLVVAFGYHVEVMLTFLAVGITLAIAHNMRHARHSEGGELVTTTAAGQAGGGKDRAAEWRAWTAENLPAAHGSQLTVLEDSGERLTAGVELRPGQVPEDITEELPRIESWAGGIREGATAIVGNFQNKLLLMIPRKDALDSPIPWHGPHAPGENIIEPIELGRYRDGSPLAMVLPHTKINGKPKVVAHLLTAGMPGAGKTEAGQVSDFSIACRAESALILCDSVKAEQSLHGLDQAAAYVASTAPMIRWLLTRLVNHTIPARAAYLGNPARNLLGKHLTNWVPGCGLKFLSVHFAEAGALVGVEAVTTIVERCRSVGIWIDFELQRASHTKVDTDARAMFGAGQSFGVEDEVDARMVLSDRLVDLGADPSAWGTDNPGYVYMEAPWVPKARRTMPARYDNIGAADLSAAVAEYRHLFQDLDPVTADSLGKPYAEFVATRVAARDAAPRQHSFNPAAHGGAVASAQAAALTSPAPSPAPSSTPPTLDGIAMLIPSQPDHHDPDELTPEEETQMKNEAADELAASFAEMVDRDDDPDLAFETAAELRAATDDVRLGTAGDLPAPGAFVRDESADIEFPGQPPEGPKMPKAEAVAVLVEILAGIGVGNEFAPKDLYQAVQERTGHSGTWVRQTLPLLASQGYIDATAARGRYVVLETDLKPELSYSR
ncbi:hypothetical protein ACIHFD_57585 [Nonomuraea sp. NPDC051941]|uniref:hypothetical protein n=1 Tax=Nonomuraea sp. NPDC051941 TaxID=3364373 RepID=UPI0037CB3AD3